jgi:hypothetical protein
LGLAPPKSTNCLVAASYAIEAAPRAGGLVAGESWRHIFPLYAQVSPRGPLPESPPKSTNCLVAASYAIEASSRAGGLVAGESWRHIFPLYAQVSPRGPLPESPPKSTNCLVAASYAIEAPSLTGGLIFGASFVQTGPDTIVNVKACEVFPILFDAVMTKL